MSVSMVSSCFTKGHLIGMVTVIRSILGSFKPLTFSMDLEKVIN